MAQRGVQDGDGEEGVEGDGEHGQDQEAAARPLFCTRPFFSGFPRARDSRQQTIFSLPWLFTIKVAI